jgi:hypothetical protein
MYIKNCKPGARSLSRSNHIANDLFVVDARFRFVSATASVDDNRRVRWNAGEANRHELVGAKRRFVLDRQNGHRLRWLPALLRTGMLLCVSTRIQTSTTKNDTGIDFDFNAGDASTNTWWGVAVDTNGDPVVQDSTDPDPGLWVSQTSLQNFNYDDGTVCENVDAETSPYLVIPDNSSLRTDMQVDLGDFGLIIYGNTMIFAMYADAGGSVRALIVSASTHTL